jgi:DNA sulfur modification protein DndC
MLEQVLGIQNEVNQAAEQLGMPIVSLINDEEQARIEELIASKTYPEKWDGTEPHGNEWFDKILPDGSIQPLIFSQDGKLNQQ